ncbi:MAG: O-linked N-acetylglucosamine transferase family protein [Burkholderiales bacterium]
MSPDEWQPLLDHGLRAYRSGDSAIAERALRGVLQLHPDQADALYHLGVLAGEAGHAEKARVLLQRAAKAQPKNPLIRARLGEVYHVLERYQDALKAYREALKLKPDMAAAHGNMGAVLQKLGKDEEAFVSYQRALQLAPPAYIQLVNMGDIRSKAGRYDEAIQYYRQAIELQPDQALAHANLANVFAEQRQWEEAESALRHALALEPARPEFYNCLGIVLYATGRSQEALSMYDQAIRLSPAFGYFYANRSNARQALSDFDGAVSDLTKAIACHGQDTTLRTDLGGILIGLGEIARAQTVFRETLEMAPEHTKAARYLLMAALYDSGITSQALFEMHRQFARRQQPNLRCAAFPNQCATERPLRIGYVSSDFRWHPVARNLRPLFEYRNRQGFQIYLYAEVKKPDATTEWFKQQADGWRSIIGLSDEAAARLIREDKIDILVLLAGRFDENRPLIAAYRAAPVQVSMHDPATSGLDEMDYLIADAHLVPRDSAERFTERIVRLPSFYLHAPLTEAPAISPLPAQTRGYVTFGSFNNPAKINERVVALWSAVLRAVPASKLLLKYRAVFEVPSVRTRYLELFGQHGIAAERIMLEGEIEKIDRHMRRYAEIDIALDTYPFTGSTTTFEALWMGVPVVTLMGERMAARWSGAMLRKLELSDLIAEDEPGYVAIAKTLASDPGRLADLRAGLREKVMRSPLCAERRRAKQIERVFRWMWRKWCAGKK